MSLSVIPLTILGQITGVTGSGETALYQVSFKSIDGTPLYGVTAVWTDEQEEIEALAAQKPYGVWINPIDGTFTVKFAGYTYVGSADLTDSDVLAGVTPIEFTSAEVSDRLLPEVDAKDAGKTVIVNESGKWELGEAGGGSDLSVLDLYVASNDANLNIEEFTSESGAEVISISAPLATLYTDKERTHQLTSYSVPVNSIIRLNMLQTAGDISYIANIYYLLDINPGGQNNEYISSAHYTSTTYTSESPTTVKMSFLIITAELHES